MSAREPTASSVNGEAYDAVQRDIIVNHVAIGPKGWGRAGSDCSIRTDSKNNNHKTGHKMDEILHFDGVEVLLNANSIKILLSEKRNQLNETQGQLDAAYQEIEKKDGQISALNDQKNLCERVNSRIRLINQCKEIVGDGERLDSLSDEELKLRNTIPIWILKTKTKAISTAFLIFWLPNHKSALWGAQQLVDTDSLLSKSFLKF